MFVKSKQIRKDLGFTLIETLVALIVFSIGLLGVAGMQITNQQSVLSAMQRTEAAIVAHSMMERIRLNMNADAQGVYDGVTLGSNNIAQPSEDCIEVNCNPVNMANYDLWVWEQEIIGVNQRGGLIAPTACISINDGIVTIEVVWRGQTRMNENPNIACGLNNVKYGDEENGNGYRRGLQFTTLLTR